MSTIQVTKQTFSLYTYLSILEASTVSDGDMTEVAGHPPVYRLPPEILAYTFGFLPELIACPIAMAHTALNVTHTSSWFRQVGIQLQPRLWNRLPLHSKELLDLFCSRVSSHIEIICTEQMWRNKATERSLMVLLHPIAIPHIRVFELTAPYDEHEEAQLIMEASYRRVVGRLFNQYVLPHYDAVQWSSLERFCVDGQGDMDVFHNVLDVLRPGDADISMSECVHSLQRLAAYDLPRIHTSFPKLTSFEHWLHAPSLRLIESIAQLGSQMRSLSLQRLRRVPFYLLAEYLPSMPSLELLKLHGFSNEEPPDTWAGCTIHLPMLRELSITCKKLDCIKPVIRNFHIMLDSANVRLGFRICARSTTWYRFITFYWTAGQTSQCFSHEPVQYDESGWDRGVSDETKAKLIQSAIDTGRELGECMRTYERVASLARDVERSTSS